VTGLIHLDSITWPLCALLAGKRHRAHRPGLAGPTYTSSPTTSGSRRGQQWTLGCGSNMSVNRVRITLLEASVGADTNSCEPRWPAPPSLRHPSQLNWSRCCTRPSLLVKSTSLYPCPGPTISNVNGGTNVRYSARLPGACASFGGGAACKV